MFSGNSGLALFPSAVPLGAALSCQPGDGARYLVASKTSGSNRRAKSLTRDVRLLGARRGRFGALLGRLGSAILVHGGESVLELVRGQVDVGTGGVDGGVAGKVIA